MTKVPCILPFRAQYAMDEGKEICCKKCGRLIPDNTLQFDIIQQVSIRCKLKKKNFLSNRLRNVFLHRTQLMSAWPKTV